MKITEENKNLYEMLYQIKLGEKTPSKKDGIITSFITVFVMIAIMTACLLFNLLFPESIIVNAIIIGVTIASILSYPFFAFKLNIHFKVREFKKKYPQIVTNINVNQLKRELEKYKKLSQQRKKDDRISSYSNNMEKSKEITREERLAYLEKERDYFKQIHYEETSHSPRVKKL